MGGKSLLVLVELVGLDGASHLQIAEDVLLAGLVGQVADGHLRLLLALALPQHPHTIIITKSYNITIDGGATAPALNQPLLRTIMRLTKRYSS